METTDKYLIVSGTLVILTILLLCVLGASWETALRHDCKIAAIQTKLYDSAHIRQICEK
jgi:hypothetical protein